MTGASERERFRLSLPRRVPAWFACTPAGELLTGWDVSKDPEAPADLHVSTLEKTYDIFDVWMPARPGTPSCGLGGIGYPNDLYLEGLTNTAAGSSNFIVARTGCHRRGPVQSHHGDRDGFMVDKDGRSMSKSGRECTRRRRTAAAITGPSQSAAGGSPACRSKMTSRWTSQPLTWRGVLHRDSQHHSVVIGNLHGMTHGRSIGSGRPAVHLDRCLASGGDRDPS